MSWAWLTSVRFRGRSRRRSDERARASQQHLLSTSHLLLRTRFSGKLEEAIATLQRAAEKDPGQPEIQEHLGDALYRSGRRFQARFAWNAALVTADDEIVGRVKAKLAVFSHYPGAAATILPLVRQIYAGPLEFGEDGMTIDVGETVNIRPLPGAGR